MDLISIFGIIIGISAILLGQVLEGGHISSLLQITAFLIVIGGTVGAVMLQSTVSQFTAGLKLLGWVFSPPELDEKRVIRDVIHWSQIARKNGLLALEDNVGGVKDPFTKKGLQMLVDGAEPDILRAALDLEITAYENQKKQAAKIWEAAGGYAPTIGIIGAVLGLIHVMENLSDPSKLGSGIAVAFVATVYGVGSANLFFLPVANKLKTLIAARVVAKDMMVEGLISICNGENPRIIESKLQGFIAR